MYSNQNPALRLILIYDISAQRGALLSVFLGIPGLGLLSFGLVNRDYLPFAFLGILAFVGALFCLGIMLRRFRIIQRVFNNGIATHCTVVKAGRFGDEITLNGRYDYQGKSYSFSTVLQSTQRINSLSRGDKLILMTDQDNPKQAFIRDLYVLGGIEDIRLSDTEKTPPRLMWPTASGNENEFIDNPSEMQIVNLIHDVYMKKRNYAILELDVEKNLYMSIYDGGKDIRHCVGPDGPIYDVQDIPKETAIKVFLAYYSRDETWKTALRWKVCIESIQAFERDSGPPLDLGIP